MDNHVTEAEPQHIVIRIRTAASPAAVIHLKCWHLSVPTHKLVHPPGRSFLYIHNLLS